MASLSDLLHTYDLTIDCSCCNSNSIPDPPNLQFLKLNVFFLLRERNSLTLHYFFHFVVFFFLRCDCFETTTLPFDVFLILLIFSATTCSLQGGPPTSYK